MKATITKKNSAKRTLAGILATVALATAFLPAAASTGFGGITASAGYVTDWSAEKDDIDDYFEDEFDFDTSNYFNSIVKDENTSRQQTVINPDGSVSIVQKKKSADNLTFRSFGVANADANVIYPGALLKADANLVTGNPTPIMIGRRNINIGVPNAKMQAGCPSYITVNPANASVVNDKISTELVGKFREGADCTAQVTTKIVKVESEDQIKAKMNFSEEMWGDLKVTASADYQNKKQAVVVDISQIFYTIAADVQTSADLFPDGMKLSRIQKYIKPEAPAVMVSSVDYGKRVVALIETDDMSFDLQATVEASGLGGKIKGGAEASYSTKLKNCSINLFVAGGSSESAGKYFKDVKIDTLIDVAASNTKYDGYAVPISYTTRWAHNGAIATAKYFGYTWETETVKELTSTTPMSFSITKQCVHVDGTPKNEVIDKGSADIYGRRIIGINADGSYIKSEMQLIKHLELDYETKDKFNLPADVILDSVKIVFDYEGPDKYVDSNVTYVRLKNTEAQRTVYFSDLFRGNGHPMSDFETIQISVYGGVYGNGGDIYGRVYAPVKQDKLAHHEKYTLGFGYDARVCLDTIACEPGMVG